MIPEHMIDGDGSANNDTCTITGHGYGYGTADGAEPPDDEFEWENKDTQDDPIINGDFSTDYGDGTGYGGHGGC